MAHPDHLARLHEGFRAWESWRDSLPAVKPDLSGANLLGAELSFFNLSGVNLSEANLNHASLRRTDLSGADLSRAWLNGASCIRTNFERATLASASLQEANFNDANFREAFLVGADLTESILIHADLSEARLDNVNLSLTTLGWTRFGDTSLKQVAGLQSCVHAGRSQIDFDTLARSHNLPIRFLRGLGLPDHYIEYLPSLTGTPFDYYSVFISYTSEDTSFAQRLHADLQNQGIRCWFAPQKMRPGQKLIELIDRGIKLYDKLLLVLSEHSMQSDWVALEIMRAREREKREGRQMLFPVRLVDLPHLQSWELFDADTATDLAKEVRQYFIPDFSQWKNHDEYDRAFKSLLLSLRQDGLEIQ